MAPPSTRQPVLNKHFLCPSTPMVPQLCQPYQASGSAGQPMYLTSVLQVPAHIFRQLDSRLSSSTWLGPTTMTPKFPLKRQSIWQVQIGASSRVVVEGATQPLKHLATLIHGVGVEQHACVLDGRNASGRVENPDTTCRGPSGVDHALRGWPWVEGHVIFKLGVLAAPPDGT